MVQVGVESEDGWRPAKATPDILEWITVPGTNPPVTLQVMKGWPSAVMRAYAADYNAYIEPLRNGDSASFTPTNSVATSNHLNGTAMDLNWDSHPFRVDYAGFDGPKIARMRELLAFYNHKNVQIMFWAQDWRSPKDAMHHQMGYGTWNNPIVGEFIRDRIRPDGFSTYRRGGSVPTPTPPAATGLTADRLAQAMGNSVSIERYRTLLPGVRSAMVRSGCAGNLNRSAMWLAQIGHEGGGLKYMEEIASGAAYEGRKDLGNTQPGDGVRFKGRGPIQVTGRHNYTQLSQWAHSQGLIPSPTFFVDQPAQLASDQYGFLGVVWYWTVARPHINSMCDAGNLEGVTRAINGGLNGITDRRTRWDRCRAMGLPALAVDTTTAPPSGDDMALVPQAEWDRFKSQMDRVERELTQMHPSRSAVREPGEGPRDTWAGMDLNTDGNVDLLATFLRAKLSHPQAIARLERVAAGTEPGRSEDDALLAQAILHDIKNESVVSGTPVPMAASSTASARELAEVYAENTRLREEIARLQATAPISTALVPVGVNGSTGSTGQVIGRAYDALQELRLADALPIEDRAPLAALIGVLQTKNGSEL